MCENNNSGLKQCEDFNNDFKQIITQKIKKVASSFNELFNYINPPSIEDKKRFEIKTFKKEQRIKQWKLLIDSHCKLKWLYKKLTKKYVKIYDENKLLNKENKKLKSQINQIKKSIVIINSETN